MTKNFLDFNKSFTLEISSQDTIQQGQPKGQFKK